MRKGHRWTSSAEFWRAGRLPAHEAPENETPLRVPAMLGRRWIPPGRVGLAQGDATVLAHALGVATRGAPDSRCTAGEPTVSRLLAPDVAQSPGVAHAPTSRGRGQVSPALLRVSDLWNSYP